VGDGIVVLALEAGVVGYAYVSHRAGKKAARDRSSMSGWCDGKGHTDARVSAGTGEGAACARSTVVPILGTVLLSLSIGSMIALYANLTARANGFWISPLPLAFLGAGLLAFHFLEARAWPLTLVEKRFPTGGRRSGGDQTAFAELVRRYSVPVFHIAVSILVGLRSRAEDVAQKVFIKVHHAIASFRGEAEFSSWIYRVTFNQAGELESAGSLQEATRR